MTNALLLGGPCDQDAKQINNPPALGKPYHCQGTDYWYQLGTESPQIYVAQDHVWVVLKSGPCDGEQRGLTRDKFKSGQLMCNGKIYLNQIRNNHPWQNQYGAYIWQEAYASVAAAAPQAAYSTQGAFTAMHKTIRTLAHYVPEQIKREEAALRRIRRAVR